MNAVRQLIAVRRWPETLRWGLCFTLALGFHAAGAAALLAHWSEDSDLVANAPVVMIELAALPVAPDLTPTEVPPDTVLSKEAEPEPESPKPIEKVEIPLAPQAEMEMVPPPKPLEKKVEKKPKQKQASVNSAPSTAEQRADRAAAPSPGASSHNPNALPNWKSELVARLERATPLPPPPPEVAGGQIAISVPIRYNIRR